jgi:hypothetical protein
MVVNISFAVASGLVAAAARRFSRRLASNGAAVVRYPGYADLIARSGSNPCTDDESALAFRRLQSRSRRVIIIDAEISDALQGTKRSKGGGPDDGEAPVIVSLVEAAMQMFSAAIDALPDTNDPEFSGRAGVILSGLRKLQTALTKAASRGRATPSVIVSLSGVRTRYDDLMAMAAESPGATLGQQLYSVRRRAKLSAQETANGAGLTADLLDAIEAEEIPTDDEAARIKELLAALGG